MSNNSLRAFVGLPIFEPLQSELESVSAHLASMDTNKMSWVPHDNYHITMLFLEEQSPEWLEEFALAIDEQLVFEPIKISTTHLMPFPEASPKLLAAMIENSSELEQLHQDLKRIAKSLGFLAEKRRFKPHITLARKFPKSGKHLFLPTLKKVSMEASELVIYESQLHQTGARYFPLYGFGPEVFDAIEPIDAVAGDYSDFG
jgi:2'-5' RNA ligase